MNWTVSSRIYGGQAYSAATIEECSGIVAMLTAESETWQTLGVMWTNAKLSIQRQRLKAPLCPAMASGTSTTNQDGTVHTALPYARLNEHCDAQTADCAAVAARLDQLTDLLVRAYSLYSQAELTTQRVVNELIQQATMLFPQQTALAAGALAVGGALGGSVAEGGVNGIHALSSTAWAQEGLMAGAASLITGTRPGIGPLSTNEVNRAATMLSMVTAPAYEFVQGGRLTMWRKEARTEVVRESHSVAEALESLRRLGEERLGKIDLDSGLQYGTIAIQEYRAADGSSSWLITIPGTDGKLDSPFGWPQNVELMSHTEQRRMQADSARLVAEAMESAGIGPDDPVALVGHSQGGIVAATIASDMKDDYNIQHVVTAGSPVANHPIPASTWVTSIEVDDELVAALDGAPNPTTDTWLTVRGQVHRAPDGMLTPSVNEDGSCTPPLGAGADMPFSAASVRDASDDKEISHWLKYHQVAYRNAIDLGSPALQRHEEHFRRVIDGELVETTYWQGRMIPGAVTAPAESGVGVETLPNLAK